jgi:calcineurin-like phosphoesterase family protein
MRRIIGDIHGKWRSYMALLDGCDDSVQLGDFAWGLPHEDRVLRAALDERLAGPGRHRWIRGNHDNPMTMQDSPYWIPDGTIEGDTMYIGGALSTDRAWLVPGEDWWPEEELSYGALMDACERYAEARPRIMLTHDAPATAIRNLFPKHHIERSRTQQALESMLEIHSPDLWVFGHWHPRSPIRGTIRGCEFVCLGELQHLDM